jgi:alkanesulfonate monooxygenase SsuD/methylene tetrahydromethanopterin reductase-like flavin-dependent oxidoreductase (luciferase family)
VRALAGMEAGVHLPQIEFAGEGLSLRRLADTVEAARANGFAAVSVNDHFLFGAPWLDGLTALAAVAERSGPMTLATTVSLAALRGPVPLAKAVATLDILSGGRVIAGVGAGSSRSDYDALGAGFESRWQRFDEAVTLLRALLGGAEPPAGGRHFAVPEARLLPVPRPGGAVPLWVGSWGSAAGMRRVARLGDGWLASAYNITPAGFAAASALLREKLAAVGRPADGFPHALVTMWTWITEDRAEAERVITGRLAPLLKHDPATLRGRVCVGPPAMCAELLSGFAEAGCSRVYFWPLGAERRQIELIASKVLPLVRA